MKGIVLAGGLGTRLNPLTKLLNKHVLPVYDKPMFYYSLQTLVESGTKQIAVVSGPPFGAQIKELLKHFRFPKDCRTFFIDQPTPAGMPDAIRRCKTFAGKEPVMVIAGDNIYERGFAEETRSFTGGAVSFLRRTDDANRFGVPIYDIDGKLIGIIEKPVNIVSDWVVTGPHIFDNRVFHLIDNLRPSSRGELEIADLNIEYLKLGSLKLVKRFDYWSDVGTYDSLLSASLYIRSKLKR